jgi:hypothetical protein
MNVANAHNAAFAILSPRKDTFDSRIPVHHVNRYSNDLFLNTAFIGS